MNERGRPDEEGSHEVALGIAELDTAAATVSRESLLKALHKQNQAKPMPQPDEESINW